MLKEPYALPEGFYWVSMDVTDDAELQVNFGSLPFADHMVWKT